ncbi:MAG TPA: SHOCT domain-containing protein [Nakamurella sp.]|nr:SHOCT domain-containing protein [Nakamurella sp.]
MRPFGMTASTAVALVPPPADPSLVDRVRRWGALKEQGLLTNGEFTAAKAKLLGI